MHVHQGPVSLTRTLSILSAQGKKARALPSRPRRPRHEQARRGQDRDASTLRRRWGPYPRPAMPRRPHPGGIRSGFSKAVDPVSSRFPLHCRIRNASRRSPGSLPACRQPGNPYGPVWVPCHASRERILSPTENKISIAGDRETACRSHILRQVRRACNDSIGSDVLAEDVMR